MMPKTCYPCVRPLQCDTVGTRITVRLFAGWDFESDDVLRPDFVKIGCQGGVPMGGDLNNGVSSDAPVLMVSALHDGNTAERLMWEVRCAVLTAKPEGFVSPVTVPKTSDNDGESGGITSDFTEIRKLVAWTLELL